MYLYHTSLENEFTLHVIKSEEEEDLVGVADRSGQILQW